MRASRAVALTLIIGTFFTTQLVMMILSAGQEINVEWNVWQELLYWAVWAAMSPLILAALARWPLDTHRPRHVALSLVLAPIQTTIAFGLHFIAARPAQPWVWIAHTRSALVWGVFMGVFFYWIVALVYTRWRLRESLTRAKLEALTSQLKPHFLFNTLNAISVLTVEDGEKARRMVLRLGSLLRRSLDEEQHEVPLRQELAFLNEYLDIQRMRFGERLSVTLSIDPEALDARVPVLLLQPLVENAIKHGASPIAIRAMRNNGQLRMTVEDHGPGPGDAPEGIGLSNTRERLRTLYGGATTLRLRRADGETGACVDISMPFSL
jgi:two-component system, LytTR family, sensor kinase